MGKRTRRGKPYY